MLTGEPTLPGTSVDLGPLKAYQIPPKGTHTATVFFLHGLGDTGYGWLPLAICYGLARKLEGIKWVLPTAPQRKITANGGGTMNAWFDMLQIDPSAAPRPEDEQGLFESVDDVHELIDAEVAGGIPSERIVLMGFSQGGALTLAAGLTCAKRLAGLVVLSGYLCCAEAVAKEKSEHVPALPIFLAYGTGDRIITSARSESTVQALQERIGYRLTGHVDLVTGSGGEARLTVKVYEGLVHSADDDEMEEVLAWLEGVLPDKTDKVDVLGE